MGKTVTISGDDLPSIPALIDTDGLELLIPAKRTADDFQWGWRLCHPDLTSSRGYRWPFPGHWAKAPGPFSTSTSACPDSPGDGICAARTWAGASSGGITSPTVLIVGWLPADLLADTPDKVRARRMWVAQLVTFRRLVGPGADLHNANLRSADLCNANLYNANLYNADLYNANLYNANLRSADLCDANLYNANLYNADLCDANLHNANLYNANLYNADLRYARGDAHTALPPGYKVNPSGLIVRVSL